MSSIIGNLLDDDDFLKENNIFEMEPVFANTPFKPLDTSNKKKNEQPVYKPGKFKLPNVDLPKIEGPHLPKIEGPELPKIEGPELPKIEGPHLPDLSEVNLGVDLTDVKVGVDIDLPKFEPLPLTLPEMSFSPKLPELPDLSNINAGVDLTDVNLGVDLTDINAGVDLTDVNLGVDLTDVNLGVDLTGVSDTLAGALEQAGELAKPLTDFMGDNYDKYKDDISIKQGDGTGYGQIPIGETGTYIDYSNIADDMYANAVKDTPMSKLKGSEIYLLAKDPEEFYKQKGSEATIKALDNILKTDNEVVDSFIDGAALKGIATLIGRDLENPETWEKAFDEAVEGGVDKTIDILGESNPLLSGLLNVSKELVGKELNEENVNRAAYHGAAAAANEGAAMIVGAISDAILPGSSIVTSNIVRLLQPFKAPPNLQEKTQTSVFGSDRLLSYEEVRNGLSSGEFVKVGGRQYATKEFRQLEKDGYVSRVRTDGNPSYWTFEENPLVFNRGKWTPQGKPPTRGAQYTLRELKALGMPEPVRDTTGGHPRAYYDYEFSTIKENGKKIEVYRPKNEKYVEIFKNRWIPESMVEIFKKLYGDKKEASRD